MATAPALFPRTELAPGLSWWRTDDATGPWRLTVVRVDLTRNDLQLRAVHARDSLRGRETTSSMAERTHDAAAGLYTRVAINADFFDLRTGQSENNQVSDGEWWVGRMLTDSPFDTWDNVHTQLSVAQSGRVDIGRYVLDARVWGRGGVVPVLGFNHAPAGTYESTAWYTPRFGSYTPRDTVPAAPGAPSRRVNEVALRSAGMRGDSLLYVVQAAAAARDGTPIPMGGAVLSARGDRAAMVHAWQVGDTVRAWFGTSPGLSDARPPRQLIGGWPRIVANGVNVAHEAAQREGTISRNAEARHPRSAVGISRDGRTLWLVVVDGRSDRSVGMTLVELGDAMRTLGVWDALNFDGGGSTTLVIDGRVVNMPTDASGERAVGNALLVLQRR